MAVGTPSVIFSDNDPECIRQVTNEWAKIAGLLSGLPSQATHNKTFTRQVTQEPAKARQLLHEPVKAREHFIFIDYANTSIP